MSNEKFKGKYRIQTNRLKGYDYSSNGMYFITICTKQKIPYFGTIVETHDCASQKAIKGIPNNDIVNDMICNINNHSQGNTSNNTITNLDNNLITNLDNNFQHNVNNDLITNLDNNFQHNVNNDLRGNIDNDLIRNVNDLRGNIDNDLICNVNNDLQGNIDNDSICNVNNDLQEEETHNRASLRGTEIGIIANKYWQSIPEHYPFVLLDEFIVMPNHMHAIIVINKKPEELVWKPNAFGVQSRNLGAIIRGYKSSVKRFANLNNIDFHWQNRFHDHIIQNETTLLAVQNYIKANPSKWSRDKNNAQGLKM